MAGGSEAQPRPGHGRKRWLVFVLFAAALLLAGIHRIATAVIAGDLVQEFNIGPLALGILGSTYYYPTMAGALTAGFLADRYGPRQLAGLALGLAGAGSLIFALAPGYRVAVAGRVMTGLGLAAILPAGLKVLVTRFRRDEFATLYGVLSLAGGPSSGGRLVTAPLSAALLYFGWRGSLAMLGGATVLVAVLLLLLARERPAPSDAPGTEAAPARPEAVTGQLSLRQSVRLILRSKPGWLIFGSRHINGAAWSMLQSVVLTYYLLYGRQLDQVQADRIRLLLVLSALVAAPLGGYISDRIVRARRRPLILFRLAGILTFLPLALYPDRLPAAYLAALFGLMGITHGLGSGVALALQVELFPPAITGAVYSTYAFLGGIGSVVWPVALVISRFLSAFGTSPEMYPPAVFRSVFLFIFCNLLLSLVLLLFAPETMATEAEAAG